MELILRYLETIPQSVKAVEHTASDNSIYVFDAKCKVLQAYDAFAKEVLNNDAASSSIIKKLIK